MNFEYKGKTWLRKGFTFPGMYDYFETIKEKLTMPLEIPVYATAGEADRIRQLSEERKANLYLGRAAVNQTIRNYEKQFSDIHGVSYSGNPFLYKICLFASQKLTGMTPMVFLYTAKDPGYRYNAFAVDYQEKNWIYVSNQFFVEQSMLKEEELCYLIGHELGHAQCHHSTITKVHGEHSSDMEYSADRAGMIVCALWIRENHPEYTMDRVAHDAVLYGAASMQKIVNAFLEEGKCNWEAFDYDMIEKALDDIFRDASKLSASSGTHPHTRHRIMAMVHFSQSQLFYRCLNEDPDNYKNLYSDQQLQNIMSYQLVGNKKEDA